MAEESIVCKADIQQATKTRHVCHVEVCDRTCTICSACCIRNGLAGLTTDQKNK